MTDKKVYTFAMKCKKWNVPESLDIYKSLNIWVIISKLSNGPKHFFPIYHRKLQVTYNVLINICNYNKSYENYLIYTSIRCRIPQLKFNNSNYVKTF